MKNNKLTSKYIKDVFRFMEMYNLIKVNQMFVSFEYVKDGIEEKYSIEIVNTTTRTFHITIFIGATVQEVIEKIKDSKYYMMELIKC